MEEFTFRWKKEFTEIQHLKVNEIYMGIREENSIFWSKIYSKITFHLSNSAYVQNALEIKK